MEGEFFSRDEQSRNFWQNFQFCNISKTFFRNRILDNFLWKKIFRKRKIRSGSTFTLERNEKDESLGAFILDWWKWVGQLNPVAGVINKSGTGYKTCFRPHWELTWVDRVVVFIIDRSSRLMAQSNILLLKIFHQNCFLMGFMLTLNWMSKQLVVIFKRLKQHRAKVSKASDNF